MATLLANRTRAEVVFFVSWVNAMLSINLGIPAQRRVAAGGAGATPAYASHSSSTSDSFARPSGLQDGETLAGVFVFDGPVNLPTGWSNKGELDSAGTGTKIVCALKVASGEPDPITGFTDITVGTIARFTGTNSSTPDDGFDMGEEQESTTLTAASVVSSANNVLAVRFFFAYKDAPVSVTTLSGATLRSQYNDGVPLNHVFIATDDSLIATPGASGARDMSVDDNDLGTGITLLLRP